MPISPDALLAPTSRQEDFSYAYATAIAAAAGVSWNIPRRDINSTDLQFEGLDDAHDDAPKLIAQLKCTIDGLTEIADDPAHWRFVLKAKNYRELRIEKTHPPRILVVVRCPPDFGDWVIVNTAELMLRAEAWWVSLKGEPLLPEAQQSKTVLIPKTQRFDVSALTANMCSCP